jgi:hypothetical protein
MFSTEFFSKMTLKLLWNILFLVQGQFQVHRINLKVPPK